MNSGDLGAQHPPFPRLCNESFHSWFAVFSSFLSSSLAESDEGKEVQMYAGPRDASDSMRDGIHRFFGCLWLGTSFQQLCLRSLPSTPSRVLCFSKGLKLLWAILGFSKGQDGFLSKWACWAS
ncbi:unnamed protein product [Prunus armeniaca]